MKILKKCKFILEVTVVTFAIFSINSFAAHFATKTDDCATKSMDLSQTSQSIQPCKSKTVYEILVGSSCDIYNNLYSANKHN